MADKLTFKGEDLLLVSKALQIDESKLVFSRAMTDQGWAPARNPNAMPKAIRQKLTVCVGDGVLDFQVVSTKHKSELVVFPTSKTPQVLPKRGPWAGEPLAAAVGSEKSGKKANFTIKASPGQYVTIFVEIIMGAPPDTRLAPPAPEREYETPLGDVKDAGGLSGAWAAVWWCEADQNEAASMVPKVGLGVSVRRIRERELALIPNLENAPSYAKYFREATKQFAPSLVEKKVKKAMHLVALTLTLGSSPELVGFMVYHKKGKKGTDSDDEGETTTTSQRLWVEQVWVLEPLEGCGLDTALLSWAAKLADAEGCSSLVVPDTMPSMQLMSFKAMGFEWFDTEPHIVQMPLGGMPLPDKLSWQNPLDAVYLCNNVGKTLRAYKKKDGGFGSKKTKEPIFDMSRVYCSTSKAKIVIN